MFIIAILVSPYDVLYTTSSFSISDFLYIICFTLIFIEMAITKKSNLVFLKRDYKVFYLILFSIALGSFLSVLRSESPLDSFNYFVQYVFIFTILFSVIFYLVRNLRDLKKFIIVFVISAVPSILLVTSSSLNIYNGLDYIIRAGGGRYVGFNNIATSFGLNMCYSVIISLILFKNFKNKFVKALFFVLSLLGVYCIVLSISFSALILLSISILILGYILISESKLIYKFSFVLIMFFVITFSISGYLNGLSPEFYKYLPDTISQRLEKSDGEIGSSSVRLELNYIAIQMFIDNPLLGVGENQFNKHNLTGHNVHNTILSAAVETGIFGLLGVLLYLLVPLIWVYRIIRGSTLKLLLDNDEYLFLKLLCVIPIMRIIQTGFSGPYIQREAWIPVILLTALYMNKNKLGLKKED